MKITPAQSRAANSIIRRHGLTTFAIAIARQYRDDAPAKRGVRNTIAFWSNVHAAVTAKVQVAEASK